MSSKSFSINKTSSSRFECLKENNQPSNPKKRSFTNTNNNNTNNYTSNSNNYTSNTNNANTRQKSNHHRDEKEVVYNKFKYSDTEISKHTKNAEIAKQLDINNFPTLSSAAATTNTNININTNNTNNTNSSYMEKLTIPIVDKVKDDKIEVKDGWVSITRNNNGYSQFQYGKSTLLPTTEEELSSRSIERIIDNLCYLHNTYVNNYIESWGEDEYEKMFRFPNYDYNYFDKLDEEYDLDMEMKEDEMEEQYRSLNYDTSIY